MNLLIDNNLPVALSEHLRGLGNTCVHILEVGLEEADDLKIWASAIASEQIVVSKDEDFLLLANRVDDTGRMIWVRLGNCRNPELLAAIDRAYAGILLAIESGQRIVELR